MNQIHVPWLLPLGGNFSFTTATPPVGVPGSRGIRFDWPEAQSRVALRRVDLDAGSSGLCGQGRQMTSVYLRSLKRNISKD